MYNIDLIIKYKNIEEELLNKLKNYDYKDDIHIDLGYNQKDVLQICEDLYKHELLLAFQVKSIEDKRVHQIMSILWEKVQIYKEFIKVLELYNKNFINMDLEQTFILMFNYSLFPYLHNFIVSIYKNLDLDDNIKLLEKKILEKINNIN